MKLAYWDEEGYATELLVSTEELDKKPKATKDSDKAKKRKAEASGSAGIKKTAMSSHLQFWSDRHAELHGIKKDDDEEPNKESEIPPSVAAAPPSRSYADPNRNCCYLCMRQFKSAAEVNQHERLSQLHRDNLNNEQLVARALAKLEKHRDDQPTTEYRDRAKERRHAFGSSRQQNKAKPAAAAAVVKEDEPAPVSAQSKGAALLSKMGWSEGSGLGAQGTGISAPIATDVYAQGVGLGAQGGKLGEASEEAARNTRGRYDEFLAKTKNLARERYERMS
jgi:G-patch domain